MATLAGTYLDDTLTGGDTDDYINGGGGQDLLSGAGGDDTLEGGDGADTLAGGDGNDLLRGGNAYDQLDGGAGDDILETGSGDRLTGGAGNDRFVLTPDRSSSVYSPTPATIMDFTQGQDRIDLSRTGITDMETLQGFIQRYAVNASLIRLTLPGGDASVAVDMDRDAWTEADFIFATDNGPRAVAGTSWDETLIGASGNDTLSGNGGSDLLLGCGGDDILRPGAGASTLTGGEGQDLFILPATGSFWGAVNITDFTPGQDRIDLSALGIASLDTLRLLETTGNGESNFLIRAPGGQFTLSVNTPLTNLGADDFVLATGSDPLTLIDGSDGNDLFGGRGDDLILGGGGFDRLFGDAGNDTLSGGTGNDTLTGGAGNDVFVLTATDTLYPGTTTITDFTHGQDKLDLSALGITSLEIFRQIVAANIYGNGLHFGGVTLVTGVANGAWTADDLILADDFAGRTIVGSTGSGDLYGGSGHDRISAGLGDHRLFGGAGDDTLSGGSGYDTLVGGSGSDLFIIGHPYGTDTIQDFTPGTDMLDLSALGIGSFETLMSLVTDQVWNSPQSSVLTVNLNGQITGATLMIAKDQLQAGDVILGSKDTPLNLTGTGYANDLFGGSAGDVLTGAAGTDRLFGEAGNDTLYGGAGTDTLSGGAGLDTALFDGPLAQYRIDTANGLTLVTHLDSGATDTVTGVETLVFGDQTVTLPGEAPPILTIGDASIVEGNSGSRQLVLTASLDRAATDPVSFSLTDYGGTASFFDYQLDSRSFTFAPGTTSLSVTITVFGDATTEAHETILLQYAQLVGAVSDTGSTSGYVQATILNDDLEPGFSIDAYRAFNPALWGDDATLIDHFSRLGQYENRQTSGFDPVAYAANNPDLLAAFGLDTDALTQHFQRFGINAGREATGFDPIAYAALNPDLYALYGTDTEALASHYAQWGKAEGRQALGFDIDSYAAFNPDLYSAFGLDTDALIQHFQTYGINEDRRTFGFDAEAYAAYNRDLLEAFGLNHDALVNHYITLGVNEHRNIFAPNGFVPTDLV